MNFLGRIRNGLVVLDDNVSLPEGAVVSVTFAMSLPVQTAKNQQRVEFPLVRSSNPGSVQLTNEMIAELMDQEDASF